MCPPDECNQSTHWAHTKHIQIKLIMLIRKKIKFQIKLNCLEQACKGKLNSLPFPLSSNVELEPTVVSDVFADWHVVSARSQY